jgi:hypothetical protein
MAALQSLPQAVKAVARNPILVAFVGVVGVVQLLQLLFQPAQPLLAAAVSLGMTGFFILAVPFFQGGIIGMGEEALSGRTGARRFVSAGRANYLRLLVAYVIVFAVNFVLSIAVTVAAIIGGIGLYASDGAASLAALGTVAVVGLLFVLAYLLITFFIQFYAHAIVLGETGLVTGFRRSVSLVRRNILSVLGYSLVLLAGSLLLAAIGGGVSLLLSPQPEQTLLSLPDPSLPLLAGATILYILTVALLGAFYATYSVAFYRTIENSTSGI